MEKGNIKIAGNGFIQSGEYQTIRIMGSAKSEGKVSAETITVMGNANFHGDIQGGECTIHGDAAITGSVNLNSLKVNGNCSIDGDCNISNLTVNGDCYIKSKCKCNTLVVRGETHLKEEVNANQIKVYGALVADSDISCENLKVDGIIKCNGLINAESIIVVPRSTSYCKEMGAATISIEMSNIGILKYLQIHGEFNCDLIEGDSITLEYVTAKTIRGKSISLVKNCNIGAIEYSESLTLGKQCNVEQQMKI